MHQHYKAVFVQDIHNMNIFTELTLSPLFALLVKLPFCVILYSRCALSCEDILHPQPLEKSQIRIQQGH